MMGEGAADKAIDDVTVEDAGVLDLGLYPHRLPMCADMAALLAAPDAASEVGAVGTEGGLIGGSGGKSNDDVAFNLASISAFFRAIRSAWADIELKRSISNLQRLMSISCQAVDSTHVQQILILWFF